MFAKEVYARDYVKVNNDFYIVSTLKAWDTNAWETGLSRVDLQELIKDWLEDSEDGTLPTDEEIWELAEDYATGWCVEDHPNKKVAKKRHAEICKTAELHYGDEE